MQVVKWPLLIHLLDGAQQECNMTYLSSNVWNSLIKANYETDIAAEEDDLVFEASGIMFLVQRKDDCNNVVAQKLIHKPGTFMQAITEFRKVMIENNIQFIRVEGNIRRYKFLSKMLPRLFGDEVNIIQDYSIANRNVFYIKCY